MRNFINRMLNSNRRTTKTKSDIPFRLNFLFIIVGILFAVLIGQLAYLQIMNGSKLQAEVNRTDSTVETNNVQRGMIYDANGQVLVGNQTHQAITYVKGINATSADMYAVANKLGSYLKVSTSRLTPRNAADYYLATDAHLKAVEKQIPGIAKVAVADRYDKAVDFVMDSKSTDYQLTNAQKNAATIFGKMTGAYQLSTTYIKEAGVTQTELAQIGEHLSEMPGVKVGTAWTRNYPNGNSIKSIIGTVSTEKSGLPIDKLNTLLSEGYSRNDSVGQSYLEQLYEPVLRGSKSQTEVVTNGGDKITKEIEKYGGQKGDNLQLTLNARFQKKLSSLVKNAEQGAGGNSTGTYAVAMNPNTGAIVGMAGVDRDPSTGKITDNALGTINTSIVMGSVVKGATVSGALMKGVITPSNSTLTDSPINVGGTKKSSWFNHKGNANVSVDAAGALEISSNSYMMQLAMKEAGFKYYPGAPLTMSPSVFDTMRGYFNQFGLGVKTGIDLPGETAGIVGSSSASHIGNALDLSFGNYDAYTTMQVAQYMSTVANGGNRIQPHLVQAIRGTDADGKLGKLKDTVSPKVLNHVSMTDAQWKVVKQGLYQVVHGSNTYKTGGQLASINPGISAKTGTAQTFYKKQETVTLSLGSYAPSNDPQVVIALAMPNLGVNAESNNMTLARQIYNAYWDLVQSKSTLNNPTKSTASSATPNVNR